MLRYIVISMFMGITLLHAGNIQNLDKLEVEKQVLVLKLEAYSLKKKIIEVRNFIENDKLKKEKKIEREQALVRLKNDLRANRNRVSRMSLSYNR